MHPPSSAAPKAPAAPAATAAPADPAATADPAARDPAHASDESAARAAAGRRSTHVSVVLNIVLTAVQVAVGLLAGSQALVSDGLHSLSDLLSDAVVLMAMPAARKAADSSHPYGHQRFETLAALVIGALLLAVGLGMVASAASGLQHPEAIRPVHIVALWVALATLVAKELLFRYMMAVALRVRSALLAANAWHARSDAASSLVVAAGIVGNLLGMPLLDPLAAAVVGLMVVHMGGRFMIDALADLADRAASDAQVAALHDEIRAVPGVLGLHALRTRRTGDYIVADVHLEVDGTLTVAQGHDIASAVHERVTRNHPVLDIVTHVDPAPPPAAAPPSAP